MAATFWRFFFFANECHGRYRKHPLDVAIMSQFVIKSYKIPAYQ